LKQRINNFFYFFKSIFKIKKTKGFNIYLVLKKRQNQINSLYFFAFVFVFKNIWWLNNVKRWWGQHLPLEFQKVSRMCKNHFQGTRFFPTKQPTPRFFLSFFSFFHFLNDLGKIPSSSLNLFGNVVAIVFQSVFYSKIY